MGREAKIQPQKRTKFLKKNERMPFEATWVDLEINNIIIGEVRQKEKDKYTIQYTHMWNLKNYTS